METFCHIGVESPRAHVSSAADVIAVGPTVIVEDECGRAAVVEMDVVAMGTASITALAEDGLELDYFTWSARPAVGVTVIDLDGGVGTVDARMGRPNIVVVVGLTEDSTYVEPGVSASVTVADPRVASLAVLPGDGIPEPSVRGSHLAVAAIRTGETTLLVDVGGLHGEFPLRVQR